MNISRVGSCVVAIGVALIRLAPALAQTAAAQPVVLADGGFETDDAWQRHTRFQSAVHTVTGAAVRNGERCVRLEAALSTHPASVTQTVADLPAGIYELSVWAHGEGSLRLAVAGAGARTFTLTGTAAWQLYGLAFELDKPRAAEVSFVVPGGNVVLDDAALTPADADLRARWQRQQTVLQELYYVPDGYSAQRPASRASRNRNRCRVRTARCTTTAVTTRRGTSSRPNWRSGLQSAASRCATWLKPLRG